MPVADSADPPAKKARLSNNTRPNGLEAILSGKADKARLSAAIANGIKHSQRSHLDESRAVVGTGAAGGNGDVDMQDVGQEVIEISNEDDDDSSEYESSEDEGPDGVNGVAPGQRGGESAENTATADGEAEEPDDAEDNAEPEDTTAGAEGAVEPEEPSFGEMLRAHNPDPIDVEASFVDPMAESRALAPVSGTRALSAPSANSLGTVLTQALRTNDKELLESCFEMNDLESVRSTIERLHSSLVANLLQKLAERLHKRPGRAGNLMVWVQWSLVSHGGYLASQPEVVKRLGSLNRVIKERASGLQPLLTLKGKLDMLSAQLELRRSMQRPTTMDDDEDEEAVIYVEGQGESDEEEEEQENDGALTAQADRIPQRRKPLRAPPQVGESEASGDEDDDMPTTANGVDPEIEGSDEGSDDGEDDENGLLDGEAEETEDDTGDELTSEDDLDGGPEDGDDVSGSEDDEDSRPAKRSTAALRTGFGRRK